MFIFDSLHVLRPFSGRVEQSISCVHVCVFACLDDNFPTECTFISAFGVVVHLDPIWVKFVDQSQRSKVQGHRTNVLLFRRKATVKSGKPGWLVNVEEK